LNTQHSSESLTASIVKIAERAGVAIIRIQGGDLNIRHKEDASPLTLADEEADQIITDALRKLTASIPIVSEESEHPKEAIDAPEFWLVDPLDGTKEFVAGRKEFTVNIALIRNRVPVLGVVHAPALERTYYCDENTAYRSDSGGIKQIQVRSVSKSELVAVASRSHRDEETNQFLERHAVTETVAIGSSLKFCLVAEGDADIYPRFGPTMEWDTAAGDAVLRRAGGTMTTIDEKPFLYGKPDYRNPGFIVKGSIRN
jgi:3'(2'), 5'-bisphosphate nucleotidase